MKILFGAVLVMASLSALALEVGENLCGFRVKSVTDLPDVAGRLWRLEYEKNGADLAWLERDDDNKTFAVAFKTLPDDDTGVAHIMEHSVLCGSERFPVKEPFVELLKSSMATFLNAMTSSDMTWYPVASRNGRDFLNLAEVYLDAVFHPLSIKSDWSLRQEGWHYEYDGTNLTRNGVVYSEMKGVFGNPDSAGYRRLMSLLFPDVTYGRVSGGDPAHIPELTFAKYRDFYRRHYHPSNARLYLYGKVDLVASLKLVDSYLKDFSRQDAVPAVLRQKPVSNAARMDYESPVERRRTILLDGWVYGDFDDRERELAMDAITDLLAGDNRAPLKKALLDAGLCEEVSLWSGVKRQQYAVLRIGNADAEKADACRALVRRTLSRICREGLDRKRLAAILNRIEFRMRENDTPHGGLGFFDRMSGMWLHGGDPAEALKYTELFAKFRSRLSTDWFERVLKECLIDNPHHAELTMVPSLTLGQERQRAERAELERIKSGLSAADLNRIAAEAKALKAHQTTPDRPEDLAKLPKLSVSDVPSEGPVPKGTISHMRGLSPKITGTVPNDVGDANTVIRVPETVPGICYLNLYFDLRFFSDGELADLPLLAALYGQLETSKRSAEDLKNELDGHLGRFSVTASATERRPQMVVRVAALGDRKEDVLRLLREVLLETQFSDTNAIAIIHRQRCLAKERSANADGRSFAARRAARGLSPRAAIREIFEGIDQLRHLQSGRTGDFAALARRIFVRERLTVSLTDNLPIDFADRVISLWPSVGTDPKCVGTDPKCPCVSAVPPPPTSEGTDPKERGLSPRSEGFETGGSVGFAACAGRLPAEVPFAGSQLVAAKIISLDYFWNEIRVKGGAYGGGLYVGRSGIVSCASWRDPSPEKSLQTFARAGTALEDFVASGRSFGNHQVSAVAAIEPHDSPSGAAASLAELYFSGRTVDDLRRERREILATTASELKSFAGTLRELSVRTVRCVFGNGNLLKLCGLDSIEPIVTNERKTNRHKD